MMKKYGRKNYFFELNPVKEFPKSQEKIGHKTSKLEKEIFEFLNETNFDFVSSFNSNKQWCINDLKKSGRIFFVDFFFKDIDLCVEVFGDYWHVNTELYSDDFYHKHKQKTAKEIRESDYERLSSIRNKGFDIVVIWEHDWNKEKEKTKSILLEVLSGYN